jgi:hypothetical protein
MTIDTTIEYRLSLRNGPIIFVWDGNRINDLILQLDKLDTTIKPLLQLNIYKGFDALGQFIGFDVKAIDSQGLCVVGTNWNSIKSIYQVLKLQKINGIQYRSGLFIKHISWLIKPTYLVEFGIYNGKIYLSGLEWSWTYCNSVGKVIAKGKSIDIESSITALNIARTLHIKGLDK